MSLSRLRSWLKSSNGRMAIMFAATLGGSFTVLYSLQEIKYEKENLKKMSTEKATHILEENKLFEEKKKLEKERKWLADKIEDNYEMVPMRQSHPDRLPVRSKSKDIVKEKFNEDRLTRAFTRCSGLRSETEKLMDMIRNRLSGRPSEAMKYKVLQEFETQFTNAYIAGQTLLNEVNDIQKDTTDDYFLKMAKEVQADVKSVVELIQDNLNDIEKTLKSLGKGSIGK